MCSFQDRLQFLQPLLRIPIIKGIKLAWCLRINDLFQQRARHHICALRNDEHAWSCTPVRRIDVGRGTGDTCTSTVRCPETRQDACDGGLAHAVGTRDHEVHTRAESETECSDEGRPRSRMMIQWFRVFVECRGSILFLGCIGRPAIGCGRRECERRDAHINIPQLKGVAVSRESGRERRKTMQGR